MLESILGTAKDYIQDAVVNHKSVPTQQHSVVSDVIFDTVSSGVKNELGGNAKSGGGINLSQLGSLLGGGNLLGGGKNSNFLSGMSKSIVDALVKKTGMTSTVAQSVVSAILPGLISTLTKKIGGGALSGGGGGSLGNVAGGLLGGLLGKK